MAESTPPRPHPLAFQMPLCIVDVVFLASLAATIVVWIAGELELRLFDTVVSAAWGWKAVAVPAAVWAARLALGWGAKQCGVAAEGLFGIGAVRKGFMAFVVLAGFFLLVEGVLAAIRFEAPLPPIVIRTGEYGKQFDPNEPLRPDRDLLWSFVPGGTMHGQPINRIGFPDREVDPVRKPNAMRVICMGDSCTAGGVPPYPVILNELLVESPPTPKAWEALHTAVHGYSVMQGLASFRKVTRDLQPDVVTLYFGWNDHWLAEYTDRARMISLRRSPTTQLLNGLREKRFFQLLTKLLKPFRQPPRKEADAELRVPPEDYRATLAELVREIQRAGATPILLTAPRARELPAVLVEDGLAASLQELHDWHDRYAEITREVARTCDVPLLDLAAILENDPQRDDWFMDDGVHLNLEGRRHVAKLIHGKLAELYGGRP